MDEQYWQSWRSAVDSRLATIEVTIPTLATKADLAKLRAEMHRRFAEMQKWMIGLFVSMFLGFGALYVTTSRAPIAAALPTQPVVIVTPSSAIAAAAKP